MRFGRHNIGYNKKRCFSCSIATWVNLLLPQPLSRHPPQLSKRKAYQHMKYPCKYTLLWCWSPKGAGNSNSFSCHVGLSIGPFKLKFLEIALTSFSPALPWSIAFGAVHPTFLNARLLRERRARTLQISWRQFARNFLYNTRYSGISH